MSAPTRGKTDRQAYLDWVAGLARMPYPTDEASVGALKEASVKSAVKWHEFRLFLVFAFTEHGRYGKSMYAAQETLAEEFDVSRPTVRKWLNLGESLGLIRFVEPATVTRGAKYEIADAGEGPPVVVIPNQRRAGNFDSPWSDGPPY